MNPKENWQSDIFKTPIKKQHILIEFQSPKINLDCQNYFPQRDLVCEFLEDKIQKHLPFFSNIKESEEKEEQIESPPNTINSDLSSQNSDSSPVIQSQAVKKEINQSETATKIKKKKCNCDKSGCLKKYCVCFKTGNICTDCQCVGCQNKEYTSQHEKNFQMTLQFLSNPQSKVCKCKKACLRDYCICHSIGRKCSKLCKCIDCENMDENDKPNPDYREKLRLQTPALKRINVSAFDDGTTQKKVKREL